MNQTQRILNDLLKGLHVNMLSDIPRYGTSARSRISELRASGYPIEDYFEKSVGGGRYKIYFLGSKFLNEYHSKVFS